MSNSRPAITKQFSFTRTFPLIALVIILLVGAYLRLYRIRDYMTFLGDEGRDVMVVRKMIVTLHPVFLGPTASVGGFFLGPLYYYFMIPFLWLFNYDPVGPSVMVALFGIATVALLFLVGKTFFNAATGLFAASLYALSPLVIAYSRSSWNPNLVPFFALLLIYSLYQAVCTDKYRWFVSIGICFGCGLQLHYLFTFLLPVAVSYLLTSKKRFVHLRKYGYIIFGILLFLFPFLAFEIKNNFPNGHSILQFVTAGKEVSTTGVGVVIDSVPSIVFRLFARLVFYFPPSEQWHLFNGILLWWWRVGIITVIVTTLGILLWDWRRKKSSQALLLLMWFVCSMGLFFFYHRAVYDYYLGIAFPLPFLLVGYLLSKGLAHRLSSIVATGLFIGLVWFNWSGQPFQNAPNRQLAQAESVARFVYDKAEGKPFNFALITGGNSDHAFRYFFELWGNKPVTIENTAIDPARKTVTDQLLIVCEIGDCKPLGNSLWEIAGFGRAEIDGEWQVGVLRVFRLVHLPVQMVQ